MNAGERRARLQDARLYLCVGLRDDLVTFLDAVLGAGVDIVQLREKHADARAQLDAAPLFRTACDAHGALFIVNDRADLAIEARADGLHVGQDDLLPVAARAIVGDEMLIGRSTHSIEEVTRAGSEPVDYYGVGPVNATPTKPGRAGVGLGFVKDAAAHATRPWFVTGGMDTRTIGETMAAGAQRFVVVRAITEAHDPAAAVREIKNAMARTTDRTR